MSDAFAGGSFSPPCDYLISNGRLTTVLSPTGSGLLLFDGIALTRRRPDLTCDDSGIFVFLRDVDDGFLWSAALQPVPSPRSGYRFRCDRDRAIIERQVRGICSRLTIEIPSHGDEEHRHLVLRNESTRVRHIEVTTYAEVALLPFRADAAHPAFSKLFVQTAWRPEDRTLIARRRPRSPDEIFPLVYHRLEGAEALQVDFETDRMTFIGRGRSLRRPRVFEPGIALSGTAGNVIDPILSLRTVVAIRPGSEVSLRSILGAALAPSTASIDLSLGVDVCGDQPGSEYFDASTGDAVEYAGEDLVDDDREGRSNPTTPGLAGLDQSERQGETARGQGQRPARSQTGAIHPETAVRDAAAGLTFFNGWGGFTPDGKGYEIRLKAQAGDDPDRPPQPWTHVVANENFGFIVSESGAATTWSGNSRRNRLTPWFNDPVRDPHGEALYLTDEESGISWSPTPGPSPGPGPTTVRYGFGRVTFCSSCYGIEQELIQFVPRSDPVKISRIRLINRRTSPVRLRLTAYAQLVLGDETSATAGHVVTRRAEDETIRLAMNPAAGPFADLVAFGALDVPGWTHGPLLNTTDRTSFLGRLGHMGSPAALRRPSRMDGCTGRGFDPCFALSTAVEVAPGATVDCIYLLGQSSCESEALELVARYRNVGVVSKALADVESFWSDLLGRVQISTPAPEIDLMTNGWLLYQTIACRLWARSAYYQSGGAFGYRDQLQDAAALVYVRPDMTRAQILLHAGHQFVEGDVMHWWHPPDDLGLRTRFSDDLLWLPFVTALYVRTSRDDGVLDESAPFMTAPPLVPGQDEALVEARVSEKTATVYEHCCHAIDRSISVGLGRHGLPLMGSGDWNDGMNRVGHAGEGESVWLAFFLSDVLASFAEVCTRKGDPGRAEAYRKHRDLLKAGIDRFGWDGEWYRRAYYDDGTPLGTINDTECRIDAIAQAWAVLSAVAPPERARMALDALESHLVSEEDELILLLTPPFDSTPHDPGYIKGYLPGVRENGGQYTHGALWAVRAFARNGRRNQAARYLTMLSPVRHCGSPERVNRYRVEPYVVAADIYGAPPHVGRGGWTWYTGSSGWMWRVAIESLFGFTQEVGRNLLIKPCLPDAWPEARIIWTEPDGQTVLEILIRNPSGCAETVIEALLDGSAAVPDADGVRILFQGDGLRHFVEILLGRKK